MTLKTLNKTVLRTCIELDRLLEKRKAALLYSLFGLLFMSNIFLLGYADEMSEQVDNLRHLLMVNNYDR